MLEEYEQPKMAHNSKKQNKNGDKNGELLVDLEEESFEEFDEDEELGEEEEEDANSEEWDLGLY